MNKKENREVNIMLKYIFSIIIGLSIIACQPPDNGEPPMPPPDQGTQMQEEPTDPAASSAEISDEELAMFVDVNIEAQEEQIDPIRDREEMATLLEDKELDLTRYHEIHNTVDIDPQLQEEVNRLIQEKQDEIPDPEQSS